MIAPLFYVCPCANYTAAVWSFDSIQTPLPHSKTLPLSLVYDSCIREQGGCFSFSPFEEWHSEMVVQTEESILQI